MSTAIRYWWCRVDWYHYDYEDCKVPKFRQEVILEDSRKENQLFPIGLFFQKLNRSKHSAIDSYNPTLGLKPMVIEQGEAILHMSLNSWKKNLTLTIQD